MIFYDNRGDGVLYDSLEDISKQIRDCYDTIFELDIEGRKSELKEEISNLRRLVFEEKELYKKVFSKKNRSIVFSMATQNIYNIKSDYDHVYDNIISMSYGSEQVGNRITMQLLFRSQMETIREACIERKGKFNFLMSDDKINFIFKREKASNILFEVMYNDVMNIFLYNLDEEIDKYRNLEIKEQLIRAKYNVLCTNPNLESRYVDDDFVLDKPYHLGKDIFFELDKADESVEKKFYKDYFDQIIKDIVSQIIILGQDAKNPGAWRFVVLYQQMLKSILTVSNGYLSGKVISSRNEIEAKQSSIGYTMIDEVLVNSDNEKVLKMSLKKENIS